MKKNLFFAAMAVVALASCSKVAVIDQNPTSMEQPIAFTNYTAGATKATVMTAAGLQTPGFGVYTVMNDDETTLFMDNVNPKGATWAYSPLKYWPKDESNTLDFYFYAPHSSSTNSNVSNPTCTSNAKTIEFAVNSTIANQSDLLWAAPVLNAVYSGNMLDSDHKVPVNFGHALAKIGFTAQRDADYTGVTIKINSVKIKGNFNTSGVMDLTKAANTAIWSSVTSTNDTEYAPALQNVTNITTTATQINTDAEYIMVVPSTSTAKTTYTITVNYTVKDEGNVETTNEITSTAAELAFEVGKQYTFNIKIGLKPIEFTVSVNGWDDGSTSDVEIK